MHVGALRTLCPLLAALCPLPPCAEKTESCCVFRDLLHFGQATFSFLERTNFS